MVGYSIDGGAVDEATLLVSAVFGYVGVEVNEGLAGGATASEDVGCLIPGRHVAGLKLELDQLAEFQTPVL